MLALFVAHREAMLALFVAHHEAMLPAPSPACPPTCPVAGAPLPSGLLSLATQWIDVGGNRFNGSLPANWTSPSLVELDLRDNQLTGALPSSWGGETALPRLALLHLQGNKLSGEGVLYGGHRTTHMLVGIQGLVASQACTADERAVLRCS